eukprot:c9748_g1_i1.p1 GENE.c9748_g1_i1~~c9748_g1_i1.p1  ORF type:complete len:1691 (-),score=465.27 c9748_g1_i1:35-4882(-)
MLATAVLMNPGVKVLALRAGETLQIFNLDMKAMMKEYVMPEEVQFWHWLDVKTLAIITSVAVYHWSMGPEAAPVKVCDRIAELAGAQIISYRASHDQQWVAITGIQAVGDRVSGAIQLYSRERGQAQFIPGHACVFARYSADKGGPANSLFAFSGRTPTASTLHVVEIGRDATAEAYAKKEVAVFYPPEAADDFPVSMQLSPRFNTLFLVTKRGFVHLYDLGTGTCLYMNRLSAETIFVTAPHEASSGMIGINKRGQVLVVGVNEDTIVRYISTALNNVPLAVQWASKYGLPGADELFASQFQQLFTSGNIAGAARVAAQSPRGFLRTPQTIQHFSQAPPVNGVPALLLYFNTLLELGKLNEYESLQLARPVLMQNKIELIQQWITEDKLTASRELGDMLKTVNPQLALGVYLRAEAAPQVVQTFAELGEYEKLVVYAQRVNYTPDWLMVLSGVARVNPAGTKDLALRIVQQSGGKVDVHALIDVFARANLVQPCTEFLLEVVKGDRDEDGPLETRLLEMNLVAAPQVADAILGNDMLTKYDKQRIAELCEKMGLMKRALENYTAIKDIIRVLTSINPNGLGPDFLVPFFGKLSIEGSLAALEAMLNQNMRANLQLVCAIAIKYSEQLTPQALIALFDKHESVEGLFFYLGSVVNFSQDPDVHYKYIEAATKANQIQEVARICRDSNFYDPARTKNFLKEARLQDQLPLIIVCDRFNFVDELTRYLYSNQMAKYLEIYVRQVNPLRAPVVIGTLLDLDANEDFLKELIANVKNSCPVDELVEEIEKRMRLKILLPFLNARIAEGVTDTPTFNAYAKILIETSNNPEKFLAENNYYDPRVIGKYCEKREPQLAVLAYTKGGCDEELIAVTNANGLYKEQARFLVGRKDAALWATALTAEAHRGHLVDAVVQTALNADSDPEAVSVCVRAFIEAQLPGELLNLLEKLVLEESRFSANRNLQGLLIRTGMKASPDRVRDYVTRLADYDPESISALLIEAGLFEEAFIALSKFKLNVRAVSVLVTNLGDLERAKVFAKRVEEPEVYSTLGEAQVRAGLIKDGVDSYIKADNASSYELVIACAHEHQAYADLVRFLTMARKKLRETIIETELVYAYARTGMLAELEEFATGPHGASVGEVGERCFAEGNFAAAKILFTSITNYARLATTLVHLREFKAAVEAAKKANNLASWREVCHACVLAEEYRLARICGLNIVVNAEELEPLVRFYEARGLFDEIMGLLDGALGDERAHTGMFTALAVLYSQHKPEAVLPHLKLFRAKLNVPKVLRACEAAFLWTEVVFLCRADEEWDTAITTMIRHVSAFNHEIFLETIVNVSAANAIYKAAEFYIAEHPMQLLDLLRATTARVDASRVVMLARKEGVLALIKPWLMEIQSINVAAVNDAVNGLFIAEDDFTGLRASIEAHHEYDHVELALQCEKHPLLEFRRVAAHLYKMLERWDQSIALSKRDQLYGDAMATAAASKSQDLAHDLLRFFVEMGSAECFAAMLFTCYELLRPDVVLELAWRARITDAMMPYMIQFLREVSEKVAMLHKAESKRQESEAETAAASAEMNVVNMMQAQAAAAPLALTYGPHGGGGGGMGMGGMNTMNMGAGNYYVGV